MDVHNLKKVSLPADWLELVTDLYLQHQDLARNSNRIVSSSETFSHSVDKNMFSLR